MKPRVYKFGGLWHVQWIDGAAFLYHQLFPSWERAVGFALTGRCQGARYTDGRGRVI